MYKTPGLGKTEDSHIDFTSSTGTISNFTLHVLHVIQGIVPLEWATILHSCGLSAKKVRVIAKRVGKYFVGAGHDSIWRPRCEAQISHEHGLSITQRAKTLWEGEGRLTCLWGIT